MTKLNKIFVYSVLILFGLMQHSCYADRQVITVNSVRVWPSPASIRIVFDLSEPAEYKLHNLTDPHRIAVDFNNAKLNSKLEQDLNHATNNSWIKKIRTGIHPSTNGFSGDKVRVVFELYNKVMPNIFSLPPNDRYGNRLVLDLESSEKQQILALFDLDDLDKTNMPVGSVTATTPAAIATKNASAAATAITIAPIIAPSSNQKSSQQLIIAIDPGHGGEDPGAIGPRGTLEKDIVLQIARILKTQINNKKNMRAYLIRNGDYYISLRERMVRARQHKADLFISLHADAFANITANGASVFVLSERGATSAAAKWLARSQNQSDTIGGVRLKNRDEVLTSVLLDLSQTANATASLDAAKNILLAMQKNVTLHKDHVEQANFMVLKAPDVPSVLVETGFISHPKTELKLRDKAYQQKIVGSIVRGVEQYFSTAPSRVR